MQGNRVEGPRGVRALCLRLRLRACAPPAALGCTLAIVSTAAPNGVAAWGYNASGQLGDGSTTTSRVPKPVPGLSG